MLEERCRCGSSSFPWPHYSIWHYALQLSASSCVIWFVPLQCISLQILLCEKIKISVTNMQTDNSNSLNLWKFHENWY